MSAVTNSTPLTVWDQNRPVPQSVIDQFVKVKDNNGLHIYYPFGWLNDVDIALPTPYFDGLTFRSWWFCGDPLAMSEIYVYEEGQLDNTFVAIELLQGYLWYKISGGKFMNSNVPVSAGNYYSIAIQMVQDKIFKLFHNDYLMHSADMQKISGRKWRVRISPAANYLFSLQYTDELKTSFPLNGLGPSFWFAGTKLQVGTTVQFQGQVLRFEDTDVIEAKFGPPDLKISFKSSSSYKDKLISFILKRTVGSFLLGMDFTNEGAVKSTPTEEPYKSGDIDPVFSDNFRLLNTYVKWGSFTSYPK